MIKRRKRRLIITLIKEDIHGNCHRAASHRGGSRRWIHQLCKPPQQPGSKVPQERWCGQRYESAQQSVGTAGPHWMRGAAWVKPCELTRRLESFATCLQGRLMSKVLDLLCRSLFKLLRFFFPLQCVVHCDILSGSRLHSLTIRGGMVHLRWEAWGAGQGWLHIHHVCHLASIV